MKTFNAAFGGGGRRPVGASHLGIARDDMAVAPTIYRLAKVNGLGTTLPLWQAA